MTNAPETRKTHVIRIVGTNKDEDVLRDIWADVERMDEAKTVNQENNWQGIVRRFRWRDDPDADGGVVEPRTRDGERVGDGSRDVVTLKLCSPDEIDQSDPEQWIPIDVSKHMRFRDSDQGVVETMINKELTVSRVVEKRRVLHYDTRMDDEAKAAFDADPKRKVFVMSADRYEKDLSAKDDTQFVEVEVIKYLKTRKTHDSKTGNGDDQGVQTKLLNQYLIDESEEAKLEVVGENDFNPPYRLDPYQNIVNVQWGGGNIFIYGIETPDPDGGVPLQQDFELDPKTGVVLNSVQYPVDEGGSSIGPGNPNFKDSTYGPRTTDKQNEALPDRLANGAAKYQGSTKVPSFHSSVAGGIIYIGSMRGTAPGSFAALMAYGAKRFNLLWMVNLDDDPFGSYDQGVWDGPQVQAVPGGGVVTAFTGVYFFEGGATNNTFKAVWGKFSKDGQLQWSGEFIGNNVFGSDVPLVVGGGLTLGKLKPG